MKKQVVYIHGGDSFNDHEDYVERLKTMPLWHMEDSEGSDKKWIYELEHELGADEYDVIRIPMPNKQNAKFDEWSIWFERHFEYLNDGAVLIGCSLGAMFLAKYLSNNDVPFQVDGLILMAGAYKLPGKAEEGSGSFLISPEDTSSITDKYDKVLIMHSEDDFIVPYENGVALSHALPKAEFISYKDKNHFLIEEFPELVEKIKSI